MSAKANFVISKIYTSGLHKFTNISYLEIENASEETLYVNEHLILSPQERRILIAPDGFATDFEMLLEQKVAPAQALDSIKLIVLYKKVKMQKQITQITQETQETQCKI